MAPESSVGERRQLALAKKIAERWNENNVDSSRRGNWMRF